MTILHKYLRNEAIGSPVAWIEASRRHLFGVDGSL